MKVRKGFVSNSSSSSYICDVCGEDVSGMDIGLEEAEMYECVNQHTFCEHHALDGEKLEEMFNDDEKEAHELSDLRYELPEQFCPLCNFESVSDADLIRYLLRWTGQTREQVAKTLRDVYPNYTAFWEDKGGTT